ARRARGRRCAEVLLELEGGAGNPAPGGEEGPRSATASAGGAGGGGGDVSPAVTSKWAKQSAGPAGDEAQNLVVGPLQAQGGNGRGHRLDADGAASGQLVAGTLKGQR